MTINNSHDAQPLPDGWVWTTVGQVVAEMRNGITRRQSKEKMGVPVTRIETISEGTINLERVRYLPDLSQETLDRYRLLKGDILFSHINSDTHLGKTAVFEREDLTLLHGMNLLLLRSNRDLIVPRLLHYLCNYYRFSGVFISVAQHAVNQSSINQRKLKAIPVPLCPLEEQRQIVAEIETQFTRLDAAVTALQRAQVTLRRYRASVLKAACEGRLLPQEIVGAIRESPDYEPADQLLARILAERRAKWEEQQWQKEIERAKKKVAQAARKAAGLPARIRDLTDDDWQQLPEDVYAKHMPKNDRWKQKYEEPQPPGRGDLPELPQGWVWTRFDSLLREPLRNGHSAKASKSADGIRTLTLTAVTLGDFSLENTKLTIADSSRVRDLWLQPGDLFIERSNTPELVGTARLYHGKPNFAIFPDLLIRARVVKKASVHYVEVVLQSEPTRSYFKRSAQGISGTMPKISQSTIGNLLVPLPPLVEQHCIITEVERRLSVLSFLETAVQANLRRAERLRQSILKRAFEGRLVPQDPDDEPAEADGAGSGRTARGDRGAPPGPRCRRASPRRDRWTPSGAPPPC